MHTDRNFIVGFEADFESLDKAITQLNGKLNAVNLPSVMQKFTKAIDESDAVVNRYTNRIDTLRLRYNTLNDTQKRYIDAIAQTNPGLRTLLSNTQAVTAAEERATAARLKLIEARSRRPSQNEIERATTNAFGAPARPSSASQSAGVFAQQMFNAELVKTGQHAGRLSGIFDTFWGKQMGRFATHLAQWTAWLLIIDTAHQAIQAFEKEVGLSIQRAGEFQTQGVLFDVSKRAAHFVGRRADNTTSNDVLKESIDLSIKYGDNVNDVAQDITQWYKATGNLNAALYMTNEALKFQVASGTDIQDTYRTLTALATQAKGLKMGFDNKTTFDLSHTHELLNDIYAASTLAGAGMKQIQSSGREMGLGMGNAAGVLMKGMEQDISALGTLKLNLQQITALNQGLVSSMGNVGGAAEAVGEKLSRFVGGIADLSKPAKAESLKKALAGHAGAFAEFRNLVNTSGDSPGGFFQAFADFYKKADPATKNILATSIASQRNYELSANTTKVILGNYNDLLKVQKDSKILDDAATKIMGTYEMEVKQVNAQWYAMTVIIGKSLLPLVQNVLAYIMQMGPNILSIAQTSANVMKNRGSDDITDALAARFPKQATPRFGGDIGNKFNSLNSNEYAGQQLANVLKANAVEQHLDIHSVFSGMENVTNRVGKNAAAYTSTHYNPEIILRRLGAMPGTRGFNDAAQQLLGNSMDGNLYVAAGRMDRSSKDFGKLSQFKLREDGRKALANYMRGVGGTEGGPSIPDGTGAGKVKGMASDARLEADAIANLKDKYTGLIDARKNNLTVIDDEIRLGERGVARYGANSAYMDQTIVGFRKKRNELGEEQKILQAERKDFLKMQTGAEAKIRAAKPGSTARTEADANLRRIHSELYAINNEWFRNKALIDDATDSIDKYSEKIITDKYTKLNRQNDLDLANAQKAFSQAPSLGAKRLAMGPLNAEFAAELKTANDEIAYYNQHEKSQGILTELQENARTYAIAKRTQLLEQQAEVVKVLKNETDNMNESLTKAFAATGQSLADTMISAANFKPADKTYYDEVFKIQRLIIDQKEDWKKKDKEISDNARTQTDDITQAERALNDANYQRLLLLDQVNLKLAEQKRHVENILSSDLYKAVDSTLTGLGSSLSSGIMSQLSGQNASNNRVTQLDKITQALVAQRNAENDIYSLTKNHTAQTDAMHAIYMRNMDAEIAKAQQRATAEKERQANPNLLKKTFDDFAKSMVDGFITQLKNKALGGLFNTDPNKELRDAMKSYADTTKNDLVGALGGGPNGFATSVDVFKTATSVLSGSVERLIGALQSSGSSGSGYNSSNSFVPPITYNIDTSGGQGNSGFATAYAAAAAAGAVGIGNMLAAGPGVSGIGAPSSSGAFSKDVSNNAGIIGTSAGMGAAFASLPMSTQLALDKSGISGGFTNGLASSSRGGVGGFGNSLQDLLKIPKGGIGAGPGSLGKDLSIAGAAYGLYNAVTGTNANGTVGGLSHGIQGGIAGAKIGSLFGPIGTAVGAGVGFFAGLLGIGNHTSPEHMPDKFDTARFTQYVGELQGSAGTAYGPPYNPSTDPVQQQLGSPILDYIQTWVGKNLSSGNKDKKALAQKLDALYGHTPGMGLGFGHDIGDEWVKGGNLSGKYTDIYSQAMTDVQNVLQLEGSTAVPQQLVGLNQYGAGSGFFPFSWNTPGYDMPAAPPGTGYPVSPGSGTGTGGSVSNGGGSVPSPSIMVGSSGSGSVSYAYSPSMISTYTPPTVINQTISLPVDGRMLARITQSYVARANSQGYSNV